MKYLCLGYHDEKTWEALSESQRDALLEETFAYADLLRNSGHLIDEKALQGARSATTLRFEKGKVSITDGPFAETKEQLGGIMLIEAKDLNHAIQLTSKIPCMRVGGSLEIRPINEDITATSSGTSRSIDHQEFFGCSVDPATRHSTKC